MTQPPDFSFVPDPRMPLRDALRGVASLADATEEALEPAARLLPVAIRTRPVTRVERPDTADDTNPAYFWPEGYLYVAFCLNVRGLVLEKDFQSAQHLSAEFSETRTWWSFRENVLEDPSLAIAFLDLFAGDQPEWSMPELFRTGRVRELAGRFYSSEVIGPHE